MGVRYAPMTRRHRFIFGVATVLALAASAVIALGRLALIRWWIANCPGAASGCTLAQRGFEWWWIPWLGLIATIAFFAHWLTRDRLRPLPSGD